MKRLNRIIEIDRDNMVAVVEPGVVTGRLQNEAETVGLFYPPDPSSLKFCTIGGNVAMGSGGPRAVKYGVTRDYVLGLEVVLPTGEIISTGTRTAKGVVGYDLTRLIIGSEGTLAVITEATLKLTPLPQSVGGITAHYADITHCARAIAAIMAQPHIPSALEFLDSAALDLIRGRHPGLLPENSLAMLMIEVDGGAAEIADSAEAIRRAAPVERGRVAAPRARRSARSQARGLLPRPSGQRPLLRRR